MILQKVEGSHAILRLRWSEADDAIKLDVRCMVCLHEKCFLNKVKIAPNKSVDILTQQLEMNSYDD